MSLDKAIEHGKEKRKPYRKSKRFDCTCRNHGACSWCRDNRLHKFNASFLCGIGSVLDLFGTMHDTRVMQIIERTDAEALASDWQAVGDDMRYAISEYDRSNHAISKNR